MLKRKSNLFDKENGENSENASPIKVNKKSPRCPEPRKSLSILTNSLQSNKKNVASKITSPDMCLDSEFSKEKVNENVVSSPETLISDKDLKESLDANCVNSFKELKVLLNNSIANEKYILGGETEELPCMLGLHIKSHGSIQMPLSDDQAETIKKTGTSNIFQLDPSQFEIKNPKWEKCFQEFANQAIQEMGCIDREVEAKLSSLLLQTKGDCIKRCQNTAKERNLFATLVIQLPSVHTGGELMVYRGTECKEVNIGGGNGAYGIHFAVHDAHLDYEIKSITSGNRILLKYSLFSKNVDPEYRLTSNQSHLKLISLMSNFHKANRYIAIAIGHEYTHESLINNGVKALKGKYSHYYNLLKGASDELYPEHKFDFHIARVALEIHYMDKEEDSRDLEMTDWYTEDGHVNSEFKSRLRDLSLFEEIIVLNRDENVTKSMLINEKTWDNDTKKTEIDYVYIRDDDDYETTSYYQYILTIWPHGNEFDAILKADLYEAIEYLGILCRQGDENELKRCYELLYEQLKTDINNVIGHPGIGSFTDIFKKLNDISLTREFFSLISDFDLFFKQDCESLVDMIATFNSDLLNNDLLVKKKPSWENILIYCYIIQCIVNCDLPKNCKSNTTEKKQLAVKFLINYILPVIGNDEEFVELKKTKDDSIYHIFKKFNYRESDAKACNYVAMFNLLCLFDDQPNYMDLFFKQCKKHISADLFRLFIEDHDLQKNRSEFTKKSFDMFENHLHELTRNSIDYYVSKCDHFANLQAENENILTFVDYNNCPSHQIFLITMMKYSNSNKETLKKFIELVQLNLKPESKEASDVFNTIARNIEEYKYEPIFIEALKNRAEWLSANLPDAPPFTWCMHEARFDCHPDVQDFLRGSKFSFHKKFKSKKQANKFINSYSERLGDYLYDMDTIVKNGGVYLEFQKDKQYFVRKFNKDFGNLSKDLKIVKEVLKKI